MQPAVATQVSLGVESTVWSLCWQAAIGREMFIHPSLATRIRWRLIDANSNRGRSLIDYVILPGEINVLTRISSGDTVASVARAVGNVVSRWVREVQQVRGPLLAGPYRAQSLHSTEDWLMEVRMFAWRPVFVGLCATPSHYPHGALRIALGLTPSRGFDSRPLLRAFGDSVPSARTSLKRWISQRPTAQEWRAWELSRGLAMATGNRGMHSTTAKLVSGSAADLIAAGGTYGMDGAFDLLVIWVAAKLSPAVAIDLHSASDANGAHGRALVALISVSLKLCSAASVARYFGRAKSTLSEQMAKCRRRIGDRQILATPFRRILEEAVELRNRSNANNAVDAVKTRE